MTRIGIIFLGKIWNHFLKLSFTPSFTFNQRLFWPNFRETFLQSLSWHQFKQTLHSIYLTSNHAKRLYLQSLKKNQCLIIKYLMSNNSAIRLIITKLWSKPIIWKNNRSWLEGSLNSKQCFSDYHFVFRSCRGFSTSFSSRNLWFKELKPI